MREFSKGLGAISLFTEDLPASRSFYKDVLGLSLIFEDEASAVFSFGDSVINLLQATNAVDLIGPAVVAGPDTGNRFQLTVWVDDTDAVVADLQSRGVTFINGPIDRPWGMRTACFADPAGHNWEVAQNLNRA